MLELSNYKASMKVQNKYEKVERIGQGAFSKVFKVRNRKTKQFLSMKEIDLSLMTPKMRKGTEREIRILRLMDHENIISLVESFRIDGKRGRVCLVAKAAVRIGEFN